MIESMEPETFILEPHFIVLKNADECQEDSQERILYATDSA